MTNVTGLQVFSDGSGAPALASHNGYVFACDTLGEVKMNLIKPVSGSRRASKIALSVCRAAYVKARDAALSPGWLAANAAMYA